MEASVQFNILPPSHGWIDTDTVPTQRLPSRRGRGVWCQSRDKLFTQPFIPPCLLVITSQPVQGSRDSSE